MFELGRKAPSLSHSLSLGHSCRESESVIASQSSTSIPVNCLQNNEVVPKFDVDYDETEFGASELVKRRPLNGHAFRENEINGFKSR